MEGQLRRSKSAFLDAHGLGSSALYRKKIVDGMESAIPKEKRRRIGIGATYLLDIFQEGKGHFSGLQDVGSGAGELLADFLAEARKLILIDGARASEPATIGLNSRLVADVLRLQMLMDDFALLVARSLLIVHLQPVFGRPGPSLTLISLRHVRIGRGDRAD